MSNRYVPTIFDELEEFVPGLINRHWPAVNTKNDVTIGETDEAVFVEFPIPGIPKDKIQISFDKGSLLVTAEDEEEKKEDRKDVKYHCKSSRRYSYRVAIPARIDEQATPEATYKDGILRVVFQKSRAARAHKITVK